MKEFLERVWQDIKQRKNLELYLVLTAIIIVFVADIVGINTTNAVTEIILAVLAILLYGLVESRHSAEDSDKKLANIEKSILKIGQLLSQNKLNEKFEKHSTITGNRQRLKNAKTLDWMSISLHKTLTIYEHELTECLKNGGQIRLLLIDPNSPIPHALAELGHSLGSSEKIVNNVRSALEIIQSWRNRMPECNLEVRVLSSQPPYRLSMLDRGLSIAYARIRLFVIPKSSDIPVVTVSAKDDKEWFEFFADQFEKYWGIGQQV